MAIKIVTRTLGKIIQQPDGKFVVTWAGCDPKTFTTEAAANQFLEKSGPKRYDVGIWTNKKLRWKTFGRKKQAEDYLARTTVARNDGVYRDIKPATFAEYAEKWKEKHLLDLKATTYGVYLCNLNKHLIPRFGPWQLQGIDTDTITDFRAELLKKGRAPNSVRSLMDLLGRFFGDAKEDGYIKYSPMPTRRRRTDGGVDGKVQRRGRALTYVQANKLLQECEADPMLKLVILLGVLAGLRRGEIFALLFEDIDWDANLIHVRRNLFWRYGKYHDIPVGEPRWEITTPKKNSARDVDLSPKLKDVLWTRYMEMQMEGKTGLIFQKDGEPVDPDVVYRYVFKPAVERVREEADKAEDAETMKMFSDLHIHDMRHTFGSWKLAEGEDIVYVSRQLGHSDVSVTANIYAHLLNKQRPAATARTDQNLFGKVAADSRVPKES
jgi:integrase